MNDGLSTMPVQYLDVCIDVTGAYSAQKTEINISLTAIGLLWTATDFIAKGLVLGHSQEKSETVVSSDAKFISKHSDSCETFQDDQMIHTNNNAENQISNAMGIDHNRLLFSIFSILQKLGADERPEVRNSSIRTLFQTLGSHGQKLSRSMWEDCLKDYVFPILDSVSHLAATSSRDEWQGKELGTRGGKAVHMLIHHSRNTAQKQWDETLVQVLGGITRLLRSFFPFLQSLSNFSVGWEHLLNFIKDSILNGSKEVGLAAINCLQTIVSSHCPKGNLAVPYIKSLLDVYELVLERSPNYKGNAANKVKQEILHGLGDLYVQAQRMFDADMYLQLLTILQQTIENSKSEFDTESEIENVPPVQRAVLDILPLLRPTEHLPSMWSLFLRELLNYLLGPEAPSLERKDEMKRTSSANQISDTIGLGSHFTANFQNSGAVSRIISKEIQLKPKADVLDVASVSMMKGGPSSPRSSDGPSYDLLAFGWSHLFAEKLVYIIVELFLEAPLVEKSNVFPEIIRGLGRCMATRRDNPKGALWRIAVDRFNRVLIDDSSRMHVDNNKDSSQLKHSRARLWKEVADVYEIFLVGSCGRALSSDAPSPEALKADELIEMTVLRVLGDSILKGQSDAPVEILLRLVTTLDRCASRVGSLPLESVGLMPSHCSRFSLSCLQMLFSLCSFTCKEDWSPTRSEVSKVSLPILMWRCELILSQFLRDENGQGEDPLPAVRVEETMCVLRELARLVIDYNTASVLPLLPNLKVVGDNVNPGCRAHLFHLFPSFCELVVAREPRVRELVQVVLRLVAVELGLQKNAIAM